MKRLLIIALLLVAPAYAQVTSNTAKRVIGGTKPATCSAGPPADIWADTTVTPPVLNVCGPANTWNAVGTGTTINPTNNAIPKRSNGTTFVDSSLSDDGTNVTATEPILVKGSGVAIAGGAADSTHPAFRVGATIGGKPSWDVLTGDNSSFTPLNAQAMCTSSAACMWSSSGVFLMGGTTANSFNADMQLRRVKANGGTAYSGADAAIVLSSGWGTTRTVSSAAGFDSQFQFVVNATGTGQAASPTIVITFKDGTWTSTPTCMVLRNDIITPFNTPPHTWVEAATTLTITFNGTPTASNVYTYRVLCSD